MPISSSSSTAAGGSPTGWGSGNGRANGSLPPSDCSSTSDAPDRSHTGAAPNTRDLSSASAEPPVRGERLWRLCESGFLWLERLIARAVPEELNPLGESGAIANTTFLVALGSGVLLLIWYRVSVFSA